jgi:alpha-L-rhamnosidase
MMAYSLGIQRDEESPGFKHFILKPEPDPTGGITRAEGYYDSIYGRIKSAWEISDGTLIYRATVPANTTATLYLPAASETTITESGMLAAEAEGVEFLKYENGRSVYHLTSGKYEFLCQHITGR